MKKTFWTINLLLILSISNALANTPEIYSGPILHEVEYYDLQSKDLSIHIGPFKQSVKKIEILNDKIKIIPELSPPGAIEQKIPNATVCIVKYLSQKEFQNLRFVQASGVSYMPSAESKSTNDGGSSYTIGSDAISLNISAPTIGGKKNSGMFFSTVIDTTISDPNEHSVRYVENNVSIGPNESHIKFGQSTTKGPVLPFNYFNISLNIHSQDDGSALQPESNRVVNNMTVTSGYGKKFDSDFHSSYEPNSDGDIDTWMSNFTVGFSDLELITSSSASSVYEYSLKPTHQSYEIETPSIDLCWSTNNYESVTTAGPELIQPQLVLWFGKQTQNWPQENLFAIIK